jgi:replicative DNA helicase
MDYDGEGPGRVPPSHVEAERSVLAACLLSRDAFLEVAELLRAEDFYRPRHGKIFETIQKVDEQGEPVDLVTLSDALESSGELDKVGGLEYLSELFTAVPTAANARYWAKIVNRKAVLRSLIEVTNEAQRTAFEDSEDLDVILDDAEKGIFQLSQNRSQVPYYGIKDVVLESFEQIEKLFDQKELVTGVPSGFKDLDKLTSGFHESELIILAARPAMGKTSFVLNMMTNAAIHAEPAHPVLFCSLEMSRHQLAMRLLCSEARVEGHKLRTGHLSEQDWPNLTMAAGQLSEAPIFIDDAAGLNLPQIRSKARRAKAEHDIGMLIIDYLQLMEVGKAVESRTQEISQISRALKSLARELQIPVVALSQLSRQVEGRQDKRPMLSDLRESGAIEQDADVVLFLYRDEYYNRNSEERGVAELIIGKQRSGPIGTVKLAFREQFTQFRDLAREQ